MCVGGEGAQEASGKSGEWVWGVSSPRALFFFFNTACRPGRGRAAPDIMGKAW